MHLYSGGSPHTQPKVQPARLEVSGYSSIGAQDSIPDSITGEELKPPPARQKQQPAKFSIPQLARKTALSNEGPVP